MKFLLIFGLLAIATHTRKAEEPTCYGEDCPPLSERTDDGQSGDGFVFQVEELQTDILSADISGPEASDIENLLADNQLTTTQAERYNYNS